MTVGQNYSGKTWASEFPSVAGLRKHLVDKFSVELLNGTLKLLDQEDNSFRLNFFALGIRELFGHTLDTLAPDGAVRACSWFVQARDTRTTTRMQRAKFATQGGLSDEFVNSLKLDIKELHAGLTDAIDQLSKYTHVRPEQVVTDEAAISAFVAEALDALLAFFEAVEEGRGEIREGVYDHIDRSVFAEFVKETIPAFDLGRGYYVEYHSIDELTVRNIDEARIYTEVKGTVQVVIEGGSGDDAVEIDHDFPFSMRLTAPVDDITSFTRTGYRIVMSGWNEEWPDEMEGDYRDAIS